MSNFVVSALTADGRAPLGVMLSSGTVMAKFGSRKLDDISGDLVTRPFWVTLTLILTGQEKRIRIRIPLIDCQRNV